ncbi:MAG TPA: tetratricopeptide repeat protein, partial [Candidatus Bathyarchaeota archaeon]|nr:tetratricopeptide repeat protein [Candidatus Bathyarchaeota archaeon]
MGREETRESLELMKQGRLEEASRILLEALRENPEDPNTHFELGCLYAILGRRDKAVEEWRRCLKLNPEMGEAHYALAWAHYDIGDYETAYKHVEMAYKSGVPLEPLKELFDLFKGIERRAEISMEVEETMKGSRPSRLTVLSFYLFCCLPVFIVLLYTGVVMGFPKGFDAYHHIYKVEYILRFFPNFFWNYQWDNGIPHFGGTYPPMAYYIMALIVHLTGLSIEVVMNGWAALSVVVNILGLSAFLYKITGRRLPPLLASSLLAFTPAFWDYWFDGGNYSRVFSMGFIGPVLYLASEVYYGRRRGIVSLLLPLLCSLAITIHLIGGLTTLILVSLYILFRTEGIINKFRYVASLILSTFLLSSFYVFQYLFSNPSRRGGLFFSVEYGPPPLQALIMPGSICSFNILMIPSLIILFILYLYARRIGSERSREAWRCLLAFAFFSAFFLLRAFLGYIPNYPRNLYIMQPERLFSIDSIGLGLTIALLLSLTLESASAQGRLHKVIQVLAVSLIAASLLLGLLIELPSMKRLIYLNDKFSELDLIVVEEDLQHRIGSEALGITTGAFGCNHLTPHIRGYFFQGVPYPDWYSWLRSALFKQKSNPEETLFLIEWYAIRWILTDQDPGKFLTSPNLYSQVAKGGVWYEFEYLNASPILSAINSPSILFIGDELHYDVFLRALSLTSLGPDQCVPVMGHSKYVDAYTLEELLRFDTLILYGYRYHDREAMADLLSRYLNRGRG